jgi:hypothetical protein
LQVIKVFMVDRLYCYSDCRERCEVTDPWLCTGDPSSERNFTGSVWSGQEGENPGLHASYKVEQERIVSISDPWKCKV